jgi:hypothetical protein
MAILVALDTIDTYVGQTACLNCPVSVFDVTKFINLMLILPKVTVPMRAVRMLLLKAIGLANIVRGFRAGDADINGIRIKTFLFRTISDSVIRNVEGSLRTSFANGAARRSGVHERWNDKNGGKNCAFMETK